ncbi:hypothetical protein RQP46_008518 [Phenoliferia psychrophenolica]
MALSVPLQRTFHTNNNDYSELIGNEIAIVLRSALRVGRPDALWKTHLADLHFTYDRHPELLHRKYTLVRGSIESTADLIARHRNSPEVFHGIANHLAPAQAANPPPPPFTADDIFLGVVFNFSPIDTRAGLEFSTLVYPTYAQLSSFAPRRSDIAQMPLLPDWLAHLKMVLAKDYPRRIEDTYRDDAVASAGSAA